MIRFNYVVDVLRKEHLFLSSLLTLIRWGWREDLGKGGLLLGDYGWKRSWHKSIWYVSYLKIEGHDFEIPELKS